MWGQECKNARMQECRKFHCKDRCDDLDIQRKTYILERTYEFLVRNLTLHVTPPPSGFPHVIAVTDIDVDFDSAIRYTYMMHLCKGIHLDFHKSTPTFE